MRCIACGSENLAEGSFIGGDGQGVNFVLSDSGFWRTMLGSGTRRMTMMACLHCGHLQQHVQFTDKDRQRLATFDGPQESIVDSPEEET
jgi:hypothetical protein